MRIGELSRLTGISTRMLRHYDSIGLVSPGSRVGNGYRDYSDDDIRRLVQVERLKTLGMSLQTIRETLDDADVTPTEVIDDLIASTRARIVHEQELITRLEGVRERATTSWTEVLAVLGLMRGLDSPDPSRRQHVLLSSPDSAPTDRLVEALSEEDLNVAGSVRWALSRRTSDALPYLEAAVNSSDEHTRLQAVLAVTRVDSAESLPILQKARHHPDPRIREHAAMALGRHGERGVVGELVDMIERGSHDVDAADVLGHLTRRHDMADEVVGEVTRRLADAHAIPGARGRLAQSLGEIPGPATRNALTRLVADADRVVSVTATYLLTVSRSRRGR